MLPKDHHKPRKDGCWLSQERQVGPALVLGLTTTGWSVESATHITAFVPVTGAHDSPFSEHTDGFPCAWGAMDEGLIQTV